MSASQRQVVSVLIVGGTGVAGGNIANGFLLSQYASKVKLSLLVRKETAETVGPKKAALDAYVAKGAQLVYGDINSSESELTKALAGQSVVISAVGGAQLGDQGKLLTAAKSAGVKWFVPSEFGGDAAKIGKGSVVPIFDAKIDTAAAVLASGLDYTFFLTGSFSEYLVSPFFGIDIANASVTAPESFDTTTSSSTTLADVGLQVADAIITGKGRNQTIFTGNGPYSLGQITDLLEKATGKKFTRTVRPLSEYQKAINVNTYDYGARFQLLFGQQKGNGVSWPTSQTYAAKNGIKEVTLEEYIQKLVQAGSN